MQSNDQMRRVRLALAEHGRLDQEIEALEQRVIGASERELLAGLRMCRAYVERGLKRRGWSLTEEGWKQLS